MRRKRIKAIMMHCKYLTFKWELYALVDNQQDDIHGAYVIQVATIAAKDQPINA